MAKKKKTKKRPYTPPAAARAGGDATAAPAVPAPARASKGAAPTSEAASVRRSHKEEARQARERALRLMQRRRTARRTITFALVIAVAYGAFSLLTHVGTPKLDAATLTTAKNAGCSALVAKPDQGRGHEAPYTYTQHPATSGAHDPTWQPAGVYTDPIPEANAVHSLEHAYVIMYYAKTGPSALPAKVLAELTSQWDGAEKVIVAPYDQLPSGVSLAFAAWDELMTCPSTITPAQAKKVSAGIVKTLRGSKHAPEPNQP